jgi:hypothetical protein
VGLSLARLALTGLFRAALRSGHLRIHSGWPVSFRHRRLARLWFIHTVRPGITAPASIRFRHEEAILAASPDPERTYREVILPKNWRCTRITSAPVRSGEICT